MAQIINFLPFLKHKPFQEEYKKKLIRIRDEVETNLELYNEKESDNLAIALSASRYGIMKLAHIVGAEETNEFVAECLKTVLKNKEPVFKN